MRALSTFAILTLFSSVLASDTGDSSRGHALAAKDGAECHAIEKGQDQSPVNKLASFETIANARGMTPLALEVWLTPPHREKPHLILDATERNDLIAYIISLKQGRAKFCCMSIHLIGWGYIEEQPATFTWALPSLAATPSGCMAALISAARDLA